MGLYLTSSAETCSTIASDCKAQVIVVENDSQLQKILEVSNLCVCVCLCVRVCVRQLCISETLQFIYGFGYQKRSVVLFSPGQKQAASSEGHSSIL